MKCYVKKFEKQAIDTSCIVKVNDEEITKYDEATKTFTAYINQAVNSSVVNINTTSDVATIEVESVVYEQNFTKTVDTDSDSTVVSFSVIAENGDRTNYYLEIIKKSTDTTIATVKVNNAKGDTSQMHHIKRNPHE